jgi:hypothetical protein
VLPINLPSTNTCDQGRLFKRKRPIDELLAADGCGWRLLSTGSGAGSALAAASCLREGRSCGSAGAAGATLAPESELELRRLSRGVSLSLLLLRLLRSLRDVAAAPGFAAAAGGTSSTIGATEVGRGVAAGGASITVGAGAGSGTGAGPAKITRAANTAPSKPVPGNTLHSARCMGLVRAGASSPIIESSAA